MIEKTLVILIGNARGGEETWQSMYKNLLKPFDADLALCFGESKEKLASLYKKAKFIWEIPEYGNWRDFYVTNFNPNWDIFLNRHKFNNASLMGGIDDYNGSGAIIFAFRHYLLINKMSILNQYDRIILTRSDFYYIDEHPYLPLGNLYAVEGEGYAGVSDRHFIFDSNMSNNVLGVLDFICNNKYFYFLNKYKEDTINPEMALMLFFNFNGIINKLKFCKRVQFTVSVDYDNTRWKKKGEIFIPGSDTIRYKYINEYKTAFKNKKSRYIKLSALQIINVINKLLCYLKISNRLTLDYNKIVILDLNLNKYKSNCIKKNVKKIILYLKKCKLFDTF